MPKIGPMTTDDIAAAKYIEQLRAGLGMPKAELARRAELRREALHSYLSYKTPMTFGTVIKLASVLGVGAKDAVDGIAGVIASENVEE